MRDPYDPNSPTGLPLFNAQRPRAVSYADCAYVEGRRARAESIEVRFKRYHLDNPHVYERLREAAMKLVERGHKRLSICMLFEVVRFRGMTSTESNEGAFALCNTYKPFYARLLMDNEPELAGVFELRALKPSHQRAS